jgi:peptide/nickel transport system substrate-binding protein
MNKRTALLLGSAALAGALIAAPAIAQDDGLIIIEGNAGGDVATMNPLLASDTASRRIAAFMFPGFINANVESAVFSPVDPPLAAGGIVQDWTVDEAGTTYTFNLRQGLTWSDGTEITSADVLYAWRVAQAAAEGVVDSQLAFLIDPTGETGILDVQAPDAYTVTVTFASAECTALGNAASLYPVPSHVLPEDLTQLNDLPFNMAPDVTAGPFAFSAINPGEQTALIANDSFFDASGGDVMPAGFIYRNVPDQTVVLEQFLAGESNVIDTPAVGRRADLRAAADAGEIQVYSYPGNAWDYLALNLADPSNPQNGFDEEGNPIDQGSHPIFGDVRVRQAIAAGVDVQSLIDAAVFGEGERMTSFIIPASWAYNTDLPAIAFDPEAAAAMLEEAGWVDSDGDGVREANGAMFAEDGALLEFSLYTNEGNGRRTAIGTLVQDQLAQIGVKVNFQTIDFNTLLDIIDSQTFDTVILGWRNGWPDDPDATQLFTPQSDVVPGGSNFTSWNNEEFTDLNTQAKTLPGCDPAERAELYYRMQEIFQEEVPYVPLFAINGMYAAGDEVGGFGPYPSNLFWNADSWTLATP